MKKQHRIIVPSLVLFLLLLLIAGCLIGCNRSEKNNFQFWTPGAESLTALQDYVADVTRSGSENYIPVEDRIAVFDMDGTLYCEKAPIYVEWLMFACRVLEDPSYLIIKNVKANKVSQIIQEIGAKPVLAFGNSSGDISMAMYTTAKNPYKSMAFMVVADDTEREYGDEEKARTMYEKWDSYGWSPISMKNDWTTVYGEDVTKNVGN